MARKAQSDWFFLQNWYSLCMRGTKIHWKGQKTLNPTHKKCFSQASQPFSQFDLICCSNISGKTKFGLKCCSNISGKTDFCLKRCNISGKIDFGLKCCSNISGKTDLSWYVAATFQAKLSLSWYVAATFWEFRARELKGLKQTGFLVVLLSFSSNIVLLDSLYVHDMDILKRNRTWLAFCGSMSHWNKSPPLHRGCHHQLNK